MERDSNVLLDLGEPVQNIFEGVSAPLDIPDADARGLAVKIPVSIAPATRRVFFPVAILTIPGLIAYA